MLFAVQVFDAIKKELSKAGKVLKDYDRIMELMSTTNNFANYHRHAAQLQAPYIPCYGSPESYPLTSSSPSHQMIL